MKKDAKPKVETVLIVLQKLQKKQPTKIEKKVEEKAAEKKLKEPQPESDSSAIDLSESSDGEEQQANQPKNIAKAAKPEAAAVAGKREKPEETKPKKVEVFLMENLSEIGKEGN